MSTNGPTQHAADTPTFVKAKLSTDWSADLPSDFKSPNIKPNRSTYNFTLDLSPHKTWCHSLAD